VVQVEELNPEGGAIARTTKRAVTVRRRPLLEAPAFAGTLPAQLQALPNGSMRVEWTPVRDARETVVEVRDTQGGLIHDLAFSGTVGKLESLKPGSYRLRLRTRDQFGRLGPAGEERGLKVPDRSDLRAPAFKKIEVK
jgi:hypothetical protein